MTRFTIRIALATVAMLGVACRRHIEAPAPIRPDEEYCWWTALRTTLPLDTVAERYRHAFEMVGFSRVTSGRLADTLWVHAGPTLLEREGVAMIWDSRVVAYRAAGDTTRLRYYTAHALLSGKQAQATQAVNVGAQHIGLCGAISKAAHVTAYAPRDPTWEDSLPVWRRRE